MIISTLVISVAMLTGLYYLGSDANQANQRAGWALTKLERLEKIFGVNSK